MICCSSTVSRPQDWCQACLIQPCCKPCTKTSGIQVFHAISAQSLCPQVGHILFGTYFSTYNETFVGPGLNSENTQANASGSPNSTSMEEGMSSSIAQVSSPTTNLMQWKRSTASLLVWSIAPVLLNALHSQIKKATQASSFSGAVDWSVSGCHFCILSSNTSFMDRFDRSIEISEWN